MMERSWSWFRCIQWWISLKMLSRLRFGFHLNGLDSSGSMMNHGISPGRVSESLWIGMDWPVNFSHHSVNSKRLELSSTPPPHWIFPFITQTDGVAFRWDQQGLRHEACLGPVNPYPQSLCRIICKCFAIKALRLIDFSICQETSQNATTVDDDRKSKIFNIFRNQ